MQRSLEAESSMPPWLTHERRNWLAVVIVAGMAGFGFGNGHTTQGAIQDVSQKLGQKTVQLHTLQAVTIPKLKSSIACEQTRAEANQQVAELAIAGKRPKTDDLAVECPPATK